MAVALMFLVGIGMVALIVVGGILLAVAMYHREDD